MNKKPEISVIVPVYNREKQLWYCLRSIQLQKYTNFEVLIVDDGSTDNTATVCKDFCANDDRFKYLHQENRGVSAARNQGMKVASGEWITFVDSDCAVLNSHLSVLTDCDLKGRDLVMVSNTGGMWNGETFLSMDREQEEEKRIDLTGNKTLVDYLFGEFDPYNNEYYPIWNKFFKRQIIESGGGKI